MRTPGLAGFALIPVSGDVARQAIDGAAAGGGSAVEVPNGRAVSLSTPLLSVLVRGRRGGSVLMMGTVAPQVLEQALRELPERTR